MSSGNLVAKFRRVILQAVSHEGVCWKRSLLPVPIASPRSRLFQQYELAWSIEIKWPVREAPVFSPSCFVFYRGHPAKISEPSTQFNHPC